MNEEAVEVVLGGPNCVHGVPLTCHCGYCAAESAPPPPRRGTHHAGCACHEARRDAEIAGLRATIERVRKACMVSHTADCVLRYTHGYCCQVECPENAGRAEIAALLPPKGEP